MHLPPSEWSYASTPLMCLQGVERETLPSPTTCVCLEPLGNGRQAATNCSSNISYVSGVYQDTVSFVGVCRLMTPVVSTPRWQTDLRCASPHSCFTCAAQVSASVITLPAQWPAVWRLPLCESKRTNFSIVWDETHLNIGRGWEAACHAPVCVTETENLLLPMDVVECIAVG